MKQNISLLVSYWEENYKVKIYGKQQEAEFGVTMRQQLLKRYRQKIPQKFKKDGDKRTKGLNITLQDTQTKSVRDLNSMPLQREIDGQHKHSSLIYMNYIAFGLSD